MQTQLSIDNGKTWQHYPTLHELQPGELLRVIPDFPGDFAGSLNAAIKDTCDASPKQQAICDHQWQYNKTPGTSFKLSGHDQHGKEKIEQYTADTLQPPTIHSTAIPDLHIGDWYEFCYVDSNGTRFQGELIAVADEQCVFKMGNTANPFYFAGRKDIIRHLPKQVTLRCWANIYKNLNDGYHEYYFVEHYSAESAVNGSDESTIVTAVPFTITFVHPSGDDVSPVGDDEV